MSYDNAPVMSTESSHVRDNSRQAGRSRLDRLRSSARRATIASTAVVVFAGVGCVSLATSPMAQAATGSAAGQPSCNDRVSGVVCQETFTSSGTTNTANWDWDGASSIQIEAVAGHGGAAGDGTPGGSPGEATVFYTPTVPEAAFAYDVGSNGGAGSAGTCSVPVPAGRQAAAAGASALAGRAPAVSEVPSTGWPSATVIRTTAVVAAGRAAGTPSRAQCRLRPTPRP